MKYNMNFYDIALRYAIGYFIVMAGLLLHQVWIMLLGVPFILIGLLGMCPFFKILGINHNNFESHAPKNKITTKENKTQLPSNATLPIPNFK